MRPDGPLAVTYNRGNNNHPKVCRMDRIFVPAGTEVISIEHGYTEALSVSSDHAYVLAGVSIHPNGGGASTDS